MKTQKFHFLSELWTFDQNFFFANFFKSNKRSKFLLNSLLRIYIFAKIIEIVHYLFWNLQVIVMFKYTNHANKTLFIWRCHISCYAETRIISKSWIHKPQFWFMRNQRKIWFFTKLAIFTFYWYFSFVIITTSFREIKIIIPYKTWCGILYVCALHIAKIQNIR